MTTRPRNYTVPSTGSVLDELLGRPEPEPEAATAPPDAPAMPERAPAAAAAQPAPEQPAPAAPARAESAPRPPHVQHEADTSPPSAPKASTNRTPIGMKRQTFYVDDAVAASINDTADRVVAQLNNLVPKHRVLGALMAAGVEQAATVAAALRSELLHDLQGP